MGDNKRQSNSAALVTCVACMLFTLVTCSFVLAQYFRWQGELTDLKDQIVKALPACSRSRNDVNTMRNVAIDGALVQESSSEDLRPRSSSFSEPSSSHSRLRRSAEGNREGRKGQRRRDRKNETVQDQSATHFVLSQGTQPPKGKRSKTLHAIQFKLDADKYKDLTVDNTTKILPWWNPEDWCNERPSDFFEFNKWTGQLRILQDGLYYVYAQITYKNKASMNSFDVKIDNTTALISCTQERRFPDGSTAYKTVDNCHAAAVTRLTKDQTLSIWNAVHNFYFRPMDYSSAATFWGVMRIGHA